MVRKLAAAMLGVGVFIPGLANALGLGEIKLNSALSEPLDAEIELVQVRELTATEILPNLASTDDFSSANIERFHFLTDLKFEVIVNQQGKSVIKVRSRKPVKEPFLNFLVEVNWPAGRLLREYTLLLDPPIYSAQKAAPVQQAQTTAPAQTAAPTSSYQPPTQPQTTYTADTYSGADTAGQVQTHTIGSNDSLWSIAKSMRPSDRVSIQQTMMAIQRINPDAFINDNINLLKKGQVLRAPTEEEAMQLTSREAIAMAAEQNRQWRQRGSGLAQAPEARQIDLTGRSVDRESDPAPESSEARLKLVSGSAGASGESGQGGAGEEGGQLRDQLVVAEENIDKFRLENDELKLKVNDLEDQLDTSEKVLSLKDEQIAALQAKLRELEAEQAALADAAPSAEEEAEAVVEEPLAEMEAVEDELAMEATEEAPAEELVAEEEVDFNYEEETADSVMQGEEEPMEMAPEETAMAPEEEIAPEPEPAVTAPAEQPAQQDLVQQILSNPVYLAAGGGAIVLVLALVLLAARRKSTSDELEDEAVEDFELPEAQAEDQVPEFDSIDLEEDEAFEEAVEASVEEETVPQTSDVIAEADIYIAYGRFPQAIEMLEKAAESEPDRSDIRLKLCEVCAEANEPSTFMTHYGVLQSLGDSVAISKADSLKQKLPDMDETVIAPSLAEEPVDDIPDLDSTDSAESAFDFDASEDLDSVASELEQESDTGLDFDLGDLEDTNASFETTAEPELPPSEPMTEEEQAAGDVAGLDFDLNLDLEDSAEQEVEEPSVDFDLGDTSIEDVPETATDESTGTEDASLDFDSDFSLDDVPEANTSTSDLDLDFDSLTTEESPAADAGESDSSLDFDLDFDAGVDQPTDEPASEAPAEDEPMLDSQSAAELANELDLDLDADFLTDEASTETPPAAEAPQAAEEEDDATIIADLDMAETTPAANDFDDSGEELDFLSDADEASTKLDLARAYIDMGDRDGAKDILDEVMIEGNDNQKQEAKDLLTRLES